MKKIISTILCFMMSVCLVGCSKNTSTSVIEGENDIGTALTLVKKITKASGVDDFDLTFLKLVQDEENQIYSPLSIKYALAMLSDSTEGNTKAQIDEVLGDYQPNKYVNSENLSLANLFAVRDTIASDVNPTLVLTLSDKYDADIMVDSFETPDIINNWISDKTLGLIDGYLDQFDPELQFMIINALAIDMDWENKIQQYFEYSHPHENYYSYVGIYEDANSNSTAFNGKEVSSVEIAAVADKYDIISDLGEDKIRETVSADFKEYLQELSYYSSQYGTSDIDTIVSEYVDGYINTLKETTETYDESTDFYYYDDDDIKVFAKDLKEYNGTTFQYVGIMPKKQSLSEYVETINADSINTIVDELIDPSLDTFEDGYITEVVGEFPIFDYKYDLDLNTCLQEIGITDMFSDSTDFKKITQSNVSIETSHSSMIEFTNDGIKAAAVTTVGGLGADPGYDYNFDVPVKTIDITFDNPYMYLIRNKDTGDIWFVGTLYEGKDVVPSIYSYNDVEVKQEPSETSETINTLPKYEYIIGTGTTKKVDGVTWYEIEDGGWVAKTDDMSIEVEQSYMY